jgi:hypothetical protein
MHDSPDHHDAELLLRLYDLRREEKLRKARAWFIDKFHANSLEEAQQVCPPNSEENVYFRMTMGYWDMAASLVNRGLIHEQFFFENTGEFWLVWDKARLVIPPLREFFKDPHAYENLERLALKYEKWMAGRAPECLEARRKRLSATGGQPSGQSGR